MIPLNITENCFVKLQDGSIHGPLVRDKDEVFYWRCGASLWTKEGWYWCSGPSDFDIAEVIPDPIFPHIAPKVRKSARIADGVTIPPGAKNVSFGGETVSWDEPAKVMTIWGQDYLNNGWGFSGRVSPDDTHRLDLHIRDGEIVAAIPSRIKESGE